MIGGVDVGVYETGEQHAAGPVDDHTTSRSGKILADFDYSVALDKYAVSVQDVNTIENSNLFDEKCRHPGDPSHVQCSMEEAFSMIGGQSDRQLTLARAMSIGNHSVTWWGVAARQVLSIDATHSVQAVVDVSTARG